MARNWTADEIKYLKETYHKTSPKEIIQRLGRSFKSIACKAKALGLKKDVHYWTQAEINYLILNCERMTSGELGEKLGRTVSSVQFKMHQLGFKELCGVYSLQQAMRTTGYVCTQIMRAKENLRQCWKQCHGGIGGGRRGKFRITQQQLDDICEWLKNEKWKTAA